MPKCEIQNKNCKAKHLSWNLTKLRCNVCGASVCADEGCSKLMSYKGCRRRICSSCQKNIKDHIEIGIR